MADYIKALNEGFEAAKKADLARKEIKAILGNFKNDVLAGSEGKILIELLRFEEKVSAFELMKRGSMLGQFERETYLALAASNPALEKPYHKELARWKQSRDGYPCSLVTNGREWQFEDAESLEIGLADLLRDPKVGEVLFSLVNKTKNDE